jgi:hypothetical protein
LQRDGRGIFSALMKAPSGGYGLICAVAIAAIVGSGHSVSVAQGVIRLNRMVTTNESGSVITKDVFTRDGHTNLVRTTRTMSGVVQVQDNRFYYHGLQVADFAVMAESSGCTTQAGSPYSVSFEFGPAKAVRSAVIGTDGGVILEAFTATNGVFYPADSSLIRRANDIIGDMSKLLSPSHVTNTPPGEFRQEIDQLIEKHKDN